MTLHMQRGYSLLETLVTLAITAILVGIAVPGYQSYWAHKNIRQVQLKLIELQAMQERFRLVNGTYAKSDELEISEIEGFNVKTENVGTFTYTLIAERKANRHLTCSTLSLDHASQGKPEDCWD